MTHLPVRSRFAPSPTGFLHIGGVRTALYAWLFARHHGGTFILRIEDTDRERSTPAAVQAILDGMAWLGLEADEGPFYQTQRFDRYREVSERLLAAGKAYRCYCTRAELDEMRAAAQARGEKPRYDGRCRGGSPVRSDVDPVVRFKNPQSGKVVVEDLVKGPIVFDNAELDDLIIVRSDGTPTYNFTVVVDDADMQITHAIRGDDHVNNTPRQINMFAALELPAPAYAHLPMIHGPDGTKLSKRHGAVSVLEYRDLGFLPDALLNYLLRLGWSHGDQEIFARGEMVRLFSLDSVNSAPARFDAAKLAWVNQQHMLRAPPEQVAPLLGEQLERRGRSTADGPPLELAVTALRERTQTTAQMAERALVYYGELAGYDAAAMALLTAAARAPLVALLDSLRALPEWTEELTQRAIDDVAVHLGVKLGSVAQPLRAALTGQTSSPPIGVTLVLAGRERSLERIERALAMIDACESSGS